MKTDRFGSASIRKTGVLLIGVLLVAGAAAAGVSIHLGPLTVGIDVDSHSKKLAKALAQQTAEVRKRFGENRRALPTVQGPDGKPAYLRKDVIELTARTGEDLDKAIESVGPDLLPLENWAADELARIQAEIGTPPGPKTAAFPSGLFAPQAVAVIASLGSPPKKPASPKPASPKAVAPKPVAPPPDTVPAEKSNSVLDEVGEVVSRIFTLGVNNDLTVKLWVGSTAPQTLFSFWSQSRIKESTPAPTIIRTDGKTEAVRGTYFYRAAFSKGAVTDLIEYPLPADAPAAQQSERLDLVRGSRFFCCRFDQNYCHHVDNEKDCRP